jgi:methylmalonyl-CoA/ethylmalonyl-CoA epimerase
MTAPGPLRALGPIVQIAYLPSDFDASIKYWTETVGVGPFYVMENIQLGGMKYRGVPTDAVFSIAIAYWNDIQIELIRPENDAPSIYNGEYAVKDRPHHICIFVESIEAARRASAEIGAEILVEGTVGDSGAVLYVDAGGGPGNVIELLQPIKGSEGLFDMIRDAAKNWDGSDPVRKLG